VEVVLPEAVGEVIDGISICILITISITTLIRGVILEVVAIVA
jgi:hypothetical protein